MMRPYLRKIRQKVIKGPSRKIFNDQLKCRCLRALETSVVRWLTSAT